MYGSVDEAGDDFSAGAGVGGGAEKAALGGGGDGEATLEGGFGAEGAQDVAQPGCCGPACIEAGGGGAFGA